MNNLTGNKTEPRPASAKAPAGKAGTGKAPAAKPHSAKAAAVKAHGGKTSSAKTHAGKKAAAKKAARRRKQRQTIIRRIALCVATVILVAVAGILAIAGTVFYGPSETASDLLVNSLLETSALKFVPRIFFSEAEIQQIVSRNATEAADTVTDTSLVVIARPGDGVQQPTAEGGEGDIEPQPEIELEYVTGRTYKGYMLIVRDPSRVSVGVCNNPFGDYYGKRIDKIVEEYGAVAAINGGAFEDENGQGGGGIPIGIVYSEGERLWSKTHPYYDTLVGFDMDDKLIVATGLSADQAAGLNLRDAVTFGPALVVNGEPSVVKGSGSGLNPRTAIGQRADGTVLMLVIDGRQTNSMGASLGDLIDIMIRYGAVNAANLDGGSSSKLYYNGEFINDGVAITGSRRLCTTFIVR